jgi:hypothetical protein
MTRLLWLNALLWPVQRLLLDLRLVEAAKWVARPNEA